MKINPRAGQPAIASDLVDVPKLITAYYEDRPDPHVAEQRVVFGTSGHRGSSFDRSFNEDHILAITQAICLYRQQQKIDEPLFLGIDTHALSRPAFASALEVLAANGVDVMLAEKDDYTPTPVISHAILTYNQGRKIGLAAGIVISRRITLLSRVVSNTILLTGARRKRKSLHGSKPRPMSSYQEPPRSQADTFRQSSFEFHHPQARFPDSLCGRSSQRDRYGGYPQFRDRFRSRSVGRGRRALLGTDSRALWLNFKVVNDVVDPTFRFMTLDWDGRIRMDPSSIYAMQREKADLISKP